MNQETANYIMQRISRRKKFSLKKKYFFAIKTHPDRLYG